MEHRFHFNKERFAEHLEDYEIEEHAHGDIHLVTSKNSFPCIRHWSRLLKRSCRFYDRVKSWRFVMSHSSVSASSLATAGGYLT